MSEEAFLSQMLSDVEDEARGVYADWLEDQNDPRAPVLRHRLEMESIRRGSHRYAQAQEQWQKLQSQADPQWIATIEAPGHVKKLKKRLEKKHGPIDTLYDKQYYEGRCLFPPTSMATIQQAEEELEFSLPPLLVAIYLQIGNGGRLLCLLGLEGGQTGFDDLGFRNKDIVRGYFDQKQYQEIMEQEWPERLLPICDDLGCGMVDYLDCREPRGKVQRADSGCLSVTHESFADYFTNLWTLR